MSVMLRRGIEVLVGMALVVAILAMLPAVAEAQGMAATQEARSVNRGTEAASVVVRPSDSLWSISSERLGRNATPQQIANTVERIYALNRDRIGADPDLILPGQSLLLPPVARATPARNAAEPAESSPTGRGVKSRTERASSTTVGEAGSEAGQAPDAVAEPVALPDMPTKQPAPKVGSLSVTDAPSPVESFGRTARGLLSSVTSAIVGLFPQNPLLGRKLFGLGIILLTLIVGGLLAWKLPLDRNVGGYGVWGIPTGYVGGYTPRAKGTDRYRGTPELAPAPAVAEPEWGSENDFNSGKIIATILRRRNRSLRERTRSSKRLPRRDLVVGAHNPQVRRYYEDDYDGWALRKMRRATLLTVMAWVVLTSGMTLMADPAGADPGPSLRVEAPKLVQVYHPISINFSVEGAVGVGGYETNLLFDKKAAEFASLVEDEKGLGSLGRDIEPLGAVETPRGVSIGGFSCPVEDCVRPGEGPQTTHGSQDTVRLATVTVIPNRPGILEFKLDETKLVSATGKRMHVDPVNERFVVQVGPPTISVSRAAPSVVSWKLKNDLSPSPPGLFDLTGDSTITHADAMEAAIAWTMSRENGAACGTAVDLSRDVNHDGCIDVADVQMTVDNYDTADSRVSDASGANVPAAEREGGAPNLAVALLWSVLDWMAVEPALAQASSTFTVNSTGDGADANPGNSVCATSGGACTLRAAIEEANLHVGPDTIAFGIPGTGVKTIALGNKLPTINDESGPTIIDGYTQPGSTPNTDLLVSNAKIRVQITSPTNHNRDGLIVTSSGNLIRGLAFFKLKRSIWLYGGGATNNSVVGNFVGTNAAGNHAATNAVSSADGVTMQAGASNNSIGGTLTTDRNVVSGNANRGVVTMAKTTKSNRIVNNIIGLSPLGDKRLANIKHGVDINGGSNQNKIGGTLAGEGNVISGNGMEGVEISHEPTTTGNKVVGNLIGTDATGKTAPAYASNAEWGVHLQDWVSGNLVSNNVIGNSGKGGIAAIQRATDNVIKDNRIGVALDGSRIPNSTSGVQIGGDSYGQRVGPGNVIAFNGLNGVRVGKAGSDRNTITRNSIYANKGLGIDLEPFGRPNSNDVGDADTGPNEQLNFPIIDAVTLQKVSGRACAGCTVEVFRADSGAGAYGEGKTFVGSSIAGVDGKFAVVVSGVATGNYVTATATDKAGNTSEFSPNKAVSSA